MFQIGEFSKLTQVSIRMLRYYDETGLLKPSYVHPFTGYRLYSVDQIPSLQKIIFLRDSGFTVKEIFLVLAHWDNELLPALLQQKLQDIEIAIMKEIKKRDVLKRMIDSPADKPIAHVYPVLLKSIPSCFILSLRRILPRYSDEAELWNELTDFAVSVQVDLSPSSPPFAIYHDIDYKDNDVDVEVCFIVNEPMADQGPFRFRQTQTIDTVAYALVTGPYENIKSAYGSFAHWLTTNHSFRISGESRQICLRGPWNEALPENYLTEIQIPLTLPS